MLLPRALHEPDHRLDLAARVHLRRAETIAHTALVHQIGEIELWRGAKTITSEVHVLRRAHQYAPRARREADALPFSFTSRRIDDTRGPKLAAAIRGEDVVTRHNLLNRPLRTVGHRNERALDEA